MGRLKETTKKKASIVEYRGLKNIENQPKPIKPNHSNSINMLSQQPELKKVQYL